MAGFDDLGDPEKAKYSDAAATLGNFDDMIARLSALRPRSMTPTVRCGSHAGDDGRLMTLFINNAVRTSLTSLGPGEEAQRSVLTAAEPRVRDWCATNRWVMVIEFRPEPAPTSASSAPPGSPGQ
jgi:hypothetical protein